MTLITDTLIFRETLSVPSVVPVNGSQQYSNKYLVIEVTGGESETTPYPGITLEQIFVNNASGLVGASLPLRIGKQLIEMMPFGLYRLRLIAQGGIVRATVKIWENTGVLYNYATETPATPENNAGTITGEEIKNRLVDLVSPNRLPLSAIEGAENLGQNLQVTWENLTGKPTTFPPISHTHLWSQITDKPTFATVAISGDYNDLINKPAGGSGGGQEVLTADRTYFVRIDGSDNNNGLTNTAGGAFATIEKAVSTAKKLEPNGFSRTVQLSDGTYVISNRILIDIDLTLRGNIAAPSNVIVSSNQAITFVRKEGFCTLKIEGIRFEHTASSDITPVYFIWVNSGELNLDNVIFGKIANIALSNSVYHDSYGVYIQHNALVLAGKITFSGNIGTAIYCLGSFDFLYVGATLTISGNPRFFRFLQVGGRVFFNRFAWTVVNANNAVGQRYFIMAGAVLYTFGAAQTVLPGNAAGGAETGGVYF